MSPKVSSISWKIWQVKGQYGWDMCICMGVQGLRKTPKYKTKKYKEKNNSSEIQGTYSSDRSRKKDCLFLIGMNLDDLVVKRRGKVKG